MAPKIYANLHNHTAHSDGVFSPTELVKVAKDEGYGAVAVTDHDSVSAFSEFKAACENEGMEYLLGCEYSVVCPQYREYFSDYHLVGFHFNPEHPDVKEYNRIRSVSKTEKCEYLFERAMKEDKLPKGITWQEIVDYNNAKGITGLCNDHVYAAMHAKGLVTETDWPHYFKTCFAPSYSRSIGYKSKYPVLEIQDMISLIHDAGGIAIVAHPYNIQIRTVPQLVKWGLDGIEVWHNHMMRRGYQKEALRLALEYGLYISGGADHSGLCGGQYKFFDKPEETHHWAEPMTLGTTKEFFDEIKNMKLMDGRDDMIKQYIDLYPDVEIPTF
jgi:hypothetical protein